MNHTRIDNSVYITLSMRNVKQLMDAHASGFTMGLARRMGDGTRLYVRVEDDAEHYRDRDAGPGLDS